MAVPIFNSLVSTNPLKAQRQAQRAAYLPAGVSLADFDKREQELIDQALQLGATPAMLNTVLQGRVSPNYTLPTAVTQNVPVGSEFDVGFERRRLRDRQTPLGSIIRMFTDDSLGLVQPISDATKEVDKQNRNAMIRGQNQSMFNDLSSLNVPAYDPVANREETQALINQRAIDTDILQDEYNLDKERRIADANISQYLPNIFKSRAPSYVVGGSPGMQDTKDIGIAKDRVDIQKEIDTGKKEIVESLQAGGMTAGEAEFNLDVLRQRQDRLNRAVQNQGQRSARFDEDRKELLKSLGEDPTIKRGVSPSGTTDDTFKEKTPEEKSQDLQTAKIQTKLKDTSALDKSEGQGSGADNWFDAVNERVDLMAMGAAMLAGSSSGEGTLANLGRGLQAGIASRKGEATAAEAKKYKDATLALALMREQSNRRKNDIAAAAANQLTFRESVDALSSELQVAGADAENTKVISQFMLGRPELSRALSMLSGNNRKQFIKDFVSAGQGWVGDEIEYGNVGSAFQTALDNLKESK